MYPPPPSRDGGHQPGSSELYLPTPPREHQTLISAPPERLRSPAPAAAAARLQRRRVLVGGDATEEQLGAALSEVVRVDGALEQREPGRGTAVGRQEEVCGPARLARRLPAALGVEEEREACSHPQP